MSVIIIIIILSKFAFNTQVVFWLLARNHHFFLRIIHYNYIQFLDCTYQYGIQPPSMLGCDPLGTNITLQCAILPAADTVTFYWTQNICEAGVSGTAILPGDTSGNYQVDASLGPSFRVISFTVSESTLGYYWCEISTAVNAPLRPSTITPICQPMSNLKKCNGLYILHHRTRPECAEENSPTVISRPPHPTSCTVSSPSVSGNDIICSTNPMNFN